MKRVAWAAMVMVILSVCLWAGCGSPQKDAGPDTAAGQTAGNAAAENAAAGNAEAENKDAEKAGISWQADYSRLENPYTAALTTKDTVYGCYIKEGQVCFDRVRKENPSQKETFQLPNVSAVSGIAADEEANLYALESREEGAILWRFAADSRLENGLKVDLEDVEEADDLCLRGIDSDADGHVYVWCRMMVPKMEMVEGIEGEVWSYVDRVYVKDEALQTIFYEEIADVSGTDVLHFQIAAKNKPFFVVKDREGIYIQEIDVTKQERREEIRLDQTAMLLDAEAGDRLEYVTAADEGFLYCQNNALFVFDMDTQKAQKLLNLSTYGIFCEDIVYLAKKDTGIEIIDNHGESGYSELIRLTLGQVEKTTLTLGVTMLVQDLEQAVVEFNRYNDEYQVEVVDYIGMTGDYEKASERLRLDLVTGKAPDLIAVSGIDYRMFAQKGVLADLYELMAGDDELSRDMLVATVAGAFEEDGHLYSIAPSFQLQTMWGYGDVTGGRSGVTFKELLQLLADNGKDWNAIGGFTGDEPVLTRLCTVSMDEFVDWENGTCCFDGDYFKEVLSFAGEYTGNYTGGTYSERIRNREIVLSVGILSSVADYQVQKELYGGNVAVIGYPVAKGTGTAAAFQGSPVAVNAQKENQAGAWEFVKFYLLQGYDGQGFPVVEELFEQVMKEAMEEEWEENTDARGEEIIVREDGETQRIPKAYYNDGGGAIFVYAAAQEEVDAVRALAEGAQSRASVHPMIQNIINEEAEAYFAGQADVDRTAQLIQNRVTLLLQEAQ